MYSLVISMTDFVEGINAKLADRTTPCISHLNRHTDLDATLTDPQMQVVPRLEHKEQRQQENWISLSLLDRSSSSRMTRTESLFEGGRQVLERPLEDTV